ncbi:hypothetical protein [Streptomyces sp. NPDC058739]|uniref:hypothetical protein n=1 Tax=Streptomyces sp. NPDC058739 TaxID=3346618 RepID=UPI0036B611E6
MTSDPADLTATDYLNAARDMAAAERHFLAHLLAEEAARRIDDPVIAQSIRARYPDRATQRD